MEKEIQLLNVWFSAMHKAHGRGGNKYLADKLNLPNTTITKLINGGTKFDLKTVRTIALLQSSKDEYYSNCKLMWEHSENGFIIRGREKNNEIVLTWSKL